MNNKIYRVVDGTFPVKFMSFVYPRSVIVGSEVISMEDVQSVRVLDIKNTPRYGWFGGIVGILTFGVLGSLIGLLNHNDKVEETVQVMFNDGRYVIATHTS